MTPTFARVARSALVLVLVLAPFISAPAAWAQSVSVRWNTPSRLTPSQASDVFVRQEEGQSVPASDLFEAEKYLRTDGAASLTATVLSTAIERRLVARLGADYGEVRLRVLPPVIAWLETVVTRNTSGVEVVRLRGEALTLTVLNADPNLAAVYIHHKTIAQEWKLCGASLCAPTTLAGAVRSKITYEQSIPLDAAAPGEAASSELILATGLKGRMYNQTFPTADLSRYLGRACDPLPSQTIPSSNATGSPALIFRHTADKTLHFQENDVLCGLFALPDGASAIFTYLESGKLAAAPASAARSAVRNNPSSVDLFQ